MPIEERLALAESLLQGTNLLLYALHQGPVYSQDHLKYGCETRAGLRQNILKLRDKGHCITNRSLIEGAAYLLFTGRTNNAS